MMFPDFHTVQIMAIVNVTDNSFYSASRTMTIEAIESRIAQVVAEGATIIDIGGCSSRPGADVVPLETEWERVDIGVGVARRVAPHIAVSDAMVALPGGIGTFEELLECLTWKQLGLHNNPVVILNTDGYYDKLLACIDLMVEEQMMRPIHKEMYVVVSEPEQVLEAIKNAPSWDSSTRRLASI